MAMNVPEILKQLRDESPQIKLKALKVILEEADFSGYPVDALIELSQALGEHREYFNPTVQLHASRAFDKISMVITDLMKRSPDAIARNVATSLVDDDDEERPARPARPAAKPGGAEPPPLKGEAPAAAAPAPAADANAAPAKAVQAAPAKPAAKARPQLLIVHSDGEGRLAKFWNALIGLAASLLTLAVGWKEISTGTNPGYAAIGLASLYVILLFVPARVFPSYNKARLALAGFVGVTAWIFIEHGFGYTYALSGFLPKELRDLPLLTDFDALATKFVLLLWLLIPAYMVTVDDAPAGGTKFFVFLFTVYGAASIMESLVTRGSVEALVAEQGLFRAIPFPYVRPFYFAVNVLLPVHLVIGVFIFLRELANLSLKRMIAALLLVACAGAAGGTLFLNLRQSPYPNLADFFFPRTLERFKGNLAKGIHNRIVDRGNFESAIQDALSFEKGVFYKGESPTAEVKLEPEVLIPEGAASPSLSPNGLALAFTQSDGKKSDLKFMRLQTREIVPLVSDNARNREPVFSPDSSRIAFISDADGQDNVWVIATTKQGLKQITASSGPKSRLSWAGDWIAYESQGAIIRYPAPREAAGPKGDLKSRLRVYNKVAGDLLDTAVTANLSLDGGRVQIAFRTNEANEAAIFRQIFTCLVAASKVFAGFETQISAYEVKASYLTHELCVTTIPDIVRINLADWAYLSEEKIKIWLKTSAITRNGEPYLKEN